METVQSADGTEIAYERTGSGPPLVLVHGTSADYRSWDGIRPALEGHVSVYAVDRRGRGESGDGTDYDLEREFEDVAAVLESVDEPVTLFGHSFGALCSMEAALRSDAVRRLVLYEPTLGDAAPGYYSEAVYEELEALLADGEPEQALVSYLEDVISLPQAAIDQLRSAATWSSRVAAAHTVCREYGAAAEYGFDPERFETLRTPALLMLGEETFPWARTATAAADEALPNGWTVELEGQGHIAYATAPDRFTDELLGFVRETG